MSYHGPRAKLSRRLGIALTPKSERVMIRKPYGPGQHGQRRRRSTSEFGNQLLEKQKLKYQYNMSEKQLRRFYRRAQRMKGNPSDNLIRVLESRLDSVVYRAGFAPSVYAARQLVVHGHVLVNGARVNVPSFLLNSDDIVTLAEKSRAIPVVMEALMRVNAPAYLEVNKEQFKARIAREPQRQEVPVTCEMQLVIEWYSR